MVVQAGRGPLAFPNLADIQDKIKGSILQKQAELDAYRAMAALAGSPQWPAISRGLNNRLSFLTQKLIVEKDMAEVPALQASILAINDLVQAPEHAQGAIEACAKAIESLQKQLPSS